MKKLLIGIGSFAIIASASAVTASAQPRVTSDAAPIIGAAVSPTRFALSVNNPLGWLAGNAGVTAQYAATSHGVVRVNFSAYGHRGLAGFGAAVFQHEDQPTESGRRYDFGAGYQFFFDKAFNGISLEGGALLRNDGIKLAGEYNTTANDTRFLAATAHLGYTLRFSKNWFASAALGVAFGKETGTTTDTDLDPKMQTVSVDRFATNPEAYLRIGANLF